MTDKGEKPTKKIEKIKPLDKYDEEYGEYAALYRPIRNLNEAFILEFSDDSDELIDKPKKFEKERYPNLTRLKILIDLLNRDDVQEKTQIIELLTKLVNKMVNENKTVRHKFGFKYYENVRKYNTLDEILAKIFK